MLNVIKKIIQYPRLTQTYPDKPVDSGLFQGKPVIHAEKCTGCGECAVRCPSGAIADVANTNLCGINYDACIFCMLCEEVCSYHAIEVTTEFELAEKHRDLLHTTPLSTVSNECREEDSYEDLGMRLKQKIEKRFGRSLQIREVDSGSCNGCDYEINALNNPFNDIERFGIHFVASPRHADMLLVTGTAVRNMELALLKTYEATPNPKLVAAVGACACSGGIFRDSYATKNGIDCILPVDVYIPGCPPRPHAILYGILKAIDKI